MAMVELEPVLSARDDQPETLSHHTVDLDSHGRVDVFENLLS